MDALRTLTSMLGHYDADAADSSPAANYRKAVRLTAQLAQLVATWGRMQAGGGPIQPDPALGHAANFLYMLTGKRPDALATRAFDVSLVLHADHELNASTFAARVAAATLTDIHSAIVGAIGALKGPLHGGANADVMRCCSRSGQDAPPERSTRRFAASWRARRRFRASATASTAPRIRARRTCGACRRSSAKRAGNTRWFEMSQRIEQLVTGEKKLYPNVDFYSASTYYSLGIPIDLYTPIFAVSRISGWTAHVPRAVREQPPDPAAHRLHRPDLSAAGPAARSAIGSGSQGSRLRAQAGSDRPNGSQVAGLRSRLFS